MHRAAPSSSALNLRRSACRAFLAALCLLRAVVALSPRPAAATTNYQLNLGNTTVSSPNPLGRDTTFFESGPGGFESTLRCAGLAKAGRASPFTGISTAWPGVNNSGSSTSSIAHASTDDFLITGPSGPSVTGTMYFRAAANLAFQGGYPGPKPSFIEQAHFYFSVIAAQVNQEYGGYTHSNSVGFSGGYGPLAGSTDPSFDVVFPITGSFPVGSTFSVQMHAEAGGNTSLDNTNTPASIVADGGGVVPFTNRLGLWLGDSNGHLMDLPAGFSVASPSWDVNGGNTAVGDEPLGTFGMRVHAAPNPFTAESHISYAVAVDGHHDLAIFDLSGRLVRVLHSGWKPAGWHAATWDGRDSENRPADLGVYFAVLSGAHGTVSQRLVYIH
jgi:hypothetical protein